MRILVVNAGSSSLKLRMLDPDDHVVASDDLPAVSGAADQARIARAIGGYGRIDAAGHRIVHGGTDFSASVRVDPGVERRLRELADLAPLHQPKSLAALDAVSSALPQVPAVACFDTAFHAGLAAEAATYALPREWRERWGLRRFGFHGLSHAYVARRAAELLARPQEGFRVVTCHLGAGASLAAVRDGRSVDTTMGFTPLEGLAMATRSGSVDPGLLLWLQDHAGITVEELADGLEHRSGLRGLAGTADMREVLDASDAGDPNAQLAVGVYVHRLVAGIASMAAAMGGMDAVVFTGGVGENAQAIRDRAAQGLRFLGVGVDPKRNREQGDREISGGDASVRTLVIAAREDLQIAREVRQVLES
jgi:acetate kinase